MKKSISVIGAALMLLVASVVWYSCKKEDVVVTGSIFGTVTDFATGQPVGNVNVKLRPSGTTALTGNDGSYEFKDLDAGNYSLLLSKAEYADLDDDYTIKLEAGKDVRRDVQIRKKIASLKITDMNGQPLDTLDFGSEESVVIKTFNVFNDGTEVLTCSANYECEWITSVTGLENSIPSGQTVPVTVRIDRVALVDGDNMTLLSITSGNGSNEIVVKASFLGSAVITTNQATSVTASSATVGGNITDDGGRPVLARGICYGISQMPDINGDHTEDGSGTGSFTHNITGLSSSTTYYARAYATNRNSTYYSSNVVSFTTGSGMPTVTTTEVTNVTASTAKSGGNVTNNGGFNVTARGVCWNTMGSPDISDDHTTNGNGDGIFISNITNLAIGTTYHVRAYATNQKGTSYGVEKTFTTPNGAVTITLDAAQSVTANSATFTANISDDGGVPVAQRGICWATTQYPDVNSSHTDVGMGTGSYTVTIPNLQASTTYYVRAYAVNQAGTVYSAQRTFTTTNGLPTVTTSVVSNITANSAQCGGSISDNGGFPVTARGVCWNTMGNPDLNGDHTTNGNGNGTFAANLTNLTPGTSYHVRAYATNSTGTVYGVDVVFQTRDGVCSLSVPQVSGVTATTAVCSSSVESDGGAPITERGICWGTSQAPTIVGSHYAVGVGTGPFSQTLTSLIPSTTYYIRAYATNAHSTYYSEQVSFTTSNGDPTISNYAITSSSPVSFTGRYTVTMPQGVALLGRGVCYGTAAYPTIDGMHTTDGNATGTVETTVTGLQPNVTYYFRAYATTEYGTYYGMNESHVTPTGLPMISNNINYAFQGDSLLFISAQVTSDGGYSNVTSRGFCYNNTGNPTINDNVLPQGSGTGTFSLTIPITQAYGVYHIRAYATNAYGTTYSNDVIVEHPYAALPIFTYNGHTYKVAPETSSMKWDVANSYCENLSAYGYSDWRLPTLAEAQTMSANRNALGVSHYGSDYEWYWTSETCTTSTSTATGHYYVDMSDGYFGCILPYENKFLVARPIRIDD